MQNFDKNKFVKLSLENKTLMSVLNNIKGLFNVDLKTTLKASLMLISIRHQRPTDIKDL